MRQRLGRVLSRAAGSISGQTYIELDFPPSEVEGPRWGHGRPEHAALAEYLAGHEETYGQSLRMIGAYAAELRSVPATESDPAEPWWANPWLPELDAAALYAFLRDRRSRRYVEIGSGMSTRFAARAKRDGSLDTRITSLDPEPRGAVDALCDEIVRQPLESADPDLFQSLEAGDLVFLDGSHRVFGNSDATVFVLELLPSLASGVVVGIHDVFLPEDYPPEWTGRHYSEQYLLAAYLLGGAARLEPLLATHYAGLHPERFEIPALWQEDRPPGLRPETNASFWFAVS